VSAEQVGHPTGRRRTASRCRAPRPLPARGDVLHGRMATPRCKLLQGAGERFRNAGPPRPPCLSAAYSRWRLMPSWMKTLPHIGRMRMATRRQQRVPVCSSRPPKSWPEHQHLGDHRKSRPRWSRRDRGLAKDVAVLDVAHFVAEHGRATRGRSEPPDALWVTATTACSGLRPVAKAFGEIGLDDVTPLASASSKAQRLRAPSRTGAAPAVRSPRGRRPSQGHLVAEPVGEEVHCAAKTRKRTAPPSATESDHPRPPKCP